MNDSGASRLSSARLFSRHRLTFVLVIGSLTGINVYTGAPWWAFWPTVIWGLALMVHFLVFRASTVEDAWVDERVGDLQTKSYDFSHIDDIREKPTPSIRDRKAEPPPPAK